MKKFTLLFLLLTILTACETEETLKDPPPATPDSVNLELQIDKIRPTTITLRGNLSFTGTPPKEIGIIYSQNDEEEEYTLIITLEGNSFNTTITELKNNTSYDLKAYAKQNDKTFYSSTRSIKTESGIFEGSVELNTQNDIAEFGEKEYIELTGKLTINENSDQEITSLEPLRSLQKVSTFTIGNFSVLKSLSGLHNLNSTGSIYIHNSPKLEDITALKGITSNLMFLYILGNESLKSLKGLENISFAQQMEIKSNSALINLEGLGGLQEIHDLILEGNTRLTSLDGFNIKKAEELHIWQNPALESISALSTLGNLTILSIHYNSKLSTLTGFENLKSIDGYFSISDNRDLTNLDAFSNMDRGNLGAASVTNNENLTDFCGVQHLMIALGAESYSINRNKFNPTAEDFENGKCKL